MRLAGLALACLLSLWSGAAYAQQSIVALVNDEPISAFDVEQRMRFINATSKEAINAALKKRAIEMLIDEILQLQEAKKNSIAIDESDVQKIVGEMAQRNHMSDTQLTQALAGMGVNVSTLKSRIRANLAWQEVIRRKFRNSFVVADADIEKLVAETASTGAGKVVGDLQLQQIKLETSGNDDRAIAARIADAEELRSRFTSCEALGELVKGMQATTVHSMAGSTDQLPQPARTMVQNAKVGQITPPNIVAGGVELFAVCGRKAVKDDPKQREDAERKLMQQEFSLRAKRLLRDIRQDAFIEYR